MAIHVRRVDEGHAVADRMLDGRYGFCVVRLTVYAGHGHAAQPDGRDLEAAVAEFSGLHRIGSFLQVVEMEESPPSETERATPPFPKCPGR